MDFNAKKTISLRKSDVTELGYEICKDNPLELTYC